MVPRRSFFGGPEESRLWAPEESLFWAPEEALFWRPDGRPSWGEVPIARMWLCVLGVAAAVPQAPEWTHNGDMSTQGI